MRWNDMKWNGILIASPGAANTKLANNASKIEGDTNAASRLFCCHPASLCHIVEICDNWDGMKPYVFLLTPDSMYSCMKNSSRQWQSRNHLPYYIICNSHCLKRSRPLSYIFWEHFFNAILKKNLLKKTNPPSKLQLHPISPFDSTDARTNRRTERGGSRGCNSSGKGHGHPFYHVRNFFAHVYTPLKRSVGSRRFKTEIEKCSPDIPYPPLVPTLSRPCQ